MIRYALGTALALCVCAVTILAAEVKGTLDSVDAEKNTITIVVKDGDKEVKKTFTVADKVEIKAGKKDISADGLKATQLSKGGADVLITITTDGDKGDEKEKVKSITVTKKKKTT